MVFYTTFYLPDYYKTFLLCLFIAVGCYNAMILLYEARDESICLNNKLFFIGSSFIIIYYFISVPININS
jgi:hypothetical protein